MKKFDWHLFLKENDGPQFTLSTDEVRIAYEKIGMKVRLIDYYEDCSKTVKKFGVITIDKLEIYFLFCIHSCSLSL